MNENLMTKKIEEKMFVNCHLCIFKKLQMRLLRFLFFFFLNHTKYYQWCHQHGAQFTFNTPTVTSLSLFIIIVSVISINTYQRFYSIKTDSKGNNKIKNSKIIGYDLSLCWPWSWYPKWSRTKRSFSVKNFCGL